MKYSELQKLLQRHREQRELEEYQKHRVLSVPRTNKLHITFLIILFFILLTAIVATLVWIPMALAAKIIIGAIVLIVFLELYLKFLGIRAVECYQHYASEERRRRCLCVPSCSEYAIACFKKYTVIVALCKIRRRLYVTCTGDEYKLDPP